MSIALNLLVGFFSWLVVMGCNTISSSGFSSKSLLFLGSCFLVLPLTPFVQPRQGCKNRSDLLTPNPAFHTGLFKVQPLRGYLSVTTFSKSLISLSPSFLLLASCLSLTSSNDSALFDPVLFEVRPARSSFPESLPRLVFAS